MYVDKCLKKESTPRPEGYDAKLLAKKYILDPILCKKLFKECYAKNEKELIFKTIPTFETLHKSLQNFVASTFEPDAEYSIKNLNYFIKNHPRAYSFGMPMGAVEEIKGGDIINKKLTPEYLERLKDKYNAYVKKQVNVIEENYQDMLENLSTENSNTTVTE